MLKIKTYYFTDLTKIRKSLNQFKDIYSSTEAVNTDIKIILQVNMHPKSKLYYLSLKKQKELRPNSFNFWQNKFETFSFKNFYQNKIRKMHIAKIKEFLFKIIHNICLCRDLLYKWKISDSKNCIYCSCDCHTFKHLIFDCYEVKEFWKKIQTVLDIAISYEILIIGDKNITQNNMFSVLMYIIYKKFLVDYENIGNNREPLLSFIKNDLKYRVDIYNINPDIGFAEINIPLKFILDKLNQM